MGKQLAGIEVNCSSDQLVPVANIYFMYEDYSFGRVNNLTDLQVCHVMVLAASYFLNLKY